MFYPSLEEAKNFLEDYDLVPVFHELLIDSCTPIYIFNALKNSCENCFILESVDNRNQWGRYSFIGINPKAEITIDKGEVTLTKDGVSKTEPVGNPIEYLTKFMRNYKSPNFPKYPKFTGGLVGYFGYDSIRYIEKKLVNVPTDDINLPDVNLFLFDEIVAFDHLTNKALIILNIHKGNADEQFKACKERATAISQAISTYTPRVTYEKKAPVDIEVKSNLTKQQFVDNVLKAKEYIKDGDIFQVVLSQRFEVDNPPDAFDVYRMLRSTNPSPYLYYFNMKDFV